MLARDRIEAALAGAVVPGKLNDEEKAALAAQLREDGHSEFCIGVYTEEV